MKSGELKVGECMTISNPAEGIEPVLFKIEESCDCTWAMTWPEGDGRSGDMLVTFSVHVSRKERRKSRLRALIDKF